VGSFFSLTEEETSKIQNTFFFFFSQSCGNFFAKDFSCGARIELLSFEINDKCNISINRKPFIWTYYSTINKLTLTFKKSV